MRDLRAAIRGLIALLGLAVYGSAQVGPLSGISTIRVGVDIIAPPGWDPIHTDSVKEWLELQDQREGIKVSDTAHLTGDVSALIVTAMMPQMASDILELAFGGRSCHPAARTLPVSIIGAKYAKTKSTA